MKYSLRDFREKLREAFNYAEVGNEVIIERYGKQFELKLIKKDYSSYKLPEYTPDPKRMGKADPSIKVNNSDEPRVEPIDA